MGTLETKGLKPLKMPAAASPASRGVEEEWCADPTLSTVELTPLEARLAAKSPELSEGLSKLRAAIGEDAYAKHIAELPNLTRRFGKGNGTLAVGGRVVTELSMAFALVDK